MKHNRFSGYLLAGAIALSGLAGCSAASSFVMDNGYSASSTAPSAAAQLYSVESSLMGDMEEPMEAEWDYYDGKAEETEIQSLSTTGQPRKIVRNADLNLETMEYEPALERIPALAEQAGGYVENTSSSGISLYEKGGYYPSRRYAHFTLRVPADNLDSLITSLSQEFNLVSKSESASDISDRYYDTQAHLSNLQIQEKRLLELLEQAGELADLLEIETKLAEVRYQIETLTATMKRMDSEVSYSTVNISLEEVVEYKEVTAPPRTFGDRLAETFRGSWDNFLNVCENILFAAIYFAPLALLVIVVVIIILVIVRLVSRRKKKARSAVVSSSGNPWTPPEKTEDKSDEQ